MSWGTIVRLQGGCVVLVGAGVAYLALRANGDTAGHNLSGALPAAIGIVAIGHGLVLLQKWAVICSAALLIVCEGQIVVAAVRLADGPPLWAVVSTSAYLGLPLATFVQWWRETRLADSSRPRRAAE